MTPRDIHPSPRDGSLECLLFARRHLDYSYLCGRYWLVCGRESLVQHLYSKLPMASEGCQAAAAALPANHFRVLSLSRLTRSNS